MGLFDDVFGGTKSKAKVLDPTPDELKALRGPFRDAAQQLLGQKAGDPLKGIPAYQGQLAAPISPGEQTALANLAAQTGPGTARSQLLNSTLAGQFVDPASNPFLQDYIKTAQRETLQGLQDTLERTLPGRFTQAGHFVQKGGSSPFDMAAARAYEASANAAGDIASSIGFAAHEAERARQQEAIKFSQEEVDAGVKNLQAQALPRLIDQYGLDAGLQEFQNRTQALLQLLSLLTGAVGTGQVVTTSQTKPNVFGTLFPGGLTGSGTVVS